MNPIADNLSQVKSRIQLACEIAKRAKKDVTLVAVSKTHPAEMVRAAYEAGQIAFGENYVQEGVDKIEALQDIRQRLTWHFIGPIQSNKTRFIAESFDWVQSIDRLKIAQRLSEQRPRDLTNLNICLQVNISGESSKSGVSPRDALLTCLDLVELPNLSLRGLMAIPEPGASLKSMQEFHQLFIEIQKHLKKHQFKTQFDTLSIGMSDDLEQSIQAGSTMVRIGTAIFGARNVDENQEDLNTEQ
jgi:pyridoxal phosphate enzyme (YggS family)